MNNEEEQMLLSQIEGLQDKLSHVREIVSDLYSKEGEGSTVSDACNEVFELIDGVM